MAVVQKKGFGAGRSLLFILMTALGVFQLLPLIFMVSHAFKPLDELFLFPPRFFVRNPTLDNFSDLLVATSGTWVPFSRYLFNSVFVSVVVVLGSVLISSLCAYPLAKHHRMPGRDFIFNVIVSALMFPGAVTTIPGYLVINALGLIDKYWALILPALAAPMSMFLMRQFMMQIPDSLIDAAKVDGASELDTFLKVVVPFAKPAWATVTIFAFMGVWNDAWAPVVYMRTEAMKTLPVAIQTIAGGGIGRAGAAAAASLLMTAPVIIIFLILQSQVLSTMAYSGIKA
ncbi:MAG: carbohydrate ABC transporter permease [Limnochordia bacterium]|nr:carbohydrate ABC transporter permease [Limnochordia bacterium]MDD2628567.1 carbohydrate ABC transporter permease [Limnochordia bacterium]